MAQQKPSKEVLDKCRFMTPKFRVSYPHLFKPSGMPGTPEATHKYSITMLIPKNVDLEVFKKAIRWAKIARFGEDKTKWPKMAVPILDGDKPNKKGEIPEGYKDQWVIKANAKLDRKPGVVDEQNVLIIDPTKFYAGCYAHAQLFAYVWEFPQNSGNFGIGLQVNAVQKLGDGKPFSTAQSAENVFAPIVIVDEDEDDEDNDDEGF